MKSTQALLNEITNDYVSALKEYIPGSSDKIYLLRKLDEVIMLANTLMVPYEDDRKTDAIPVGRLLITVMTEHGVGALSLAEAVEVVQRGDPIYAQKPVTSVRSTLDRFFAGGVEIDGNRLSIRRSVTAGRSTVSLVLE